MEALVPWGMAGSNELPRPRDALSNRWPTVLTDSLRERRWRRTTTCIAGSGLSPAGCDGGQIGTCPENTNVEACVYIRHLGMGGFG